MAYELITGKDRLLDLIKSGVIDAIPENVGEISIDVRLSNIINIESNNVDGFLNDIDLMNGNLINTHKCDISKYGYILKPGCFITGYLKEYISLPNNIISRFTLRSIVAQNGIGHALSDTIRPSWSGNLVLELTNTLKNHNFILKEDLLIGQLQFFKL
jgi:deoxycytidine triphosphate deaminase